MATVTEKIEPTSFDEARGKLEWTNTIKEEMDALHQNQRRSLVLLPSDRKSIVCRWVFNIKHYDDRVVSRDKRT